jgi:hypothetical protein
MKYFYPLLFALIFTTSFQAYAQCTMPNGQPNAEMGVIVFNKAHKVMQYCNGDDWIGIWGGGGGGSGSSHWMKTGGNIYYSEGNVGVGTNDPQAKFEVTGNIITRLSGMYNDLAPAGKRFWAFGSSNATGHYYLGYRTDDVKTPGTLTAVPLRIEHGAPQNTLYLSELGYVGIGTGNPQSRLDVQGDVNERFIRLSTPASNLILYEDTDLAGFFSLRSDLGSGIIIQGQADAAAIAVRRDNSRVGVLTRTPSYQLHVNGSVAGTGAYNALSDARHKTKVEPIGYGLSDVMALNPVFYEWAIRARAGKRGARSG